MRACSVNSCAGLQRLILLDEQVRINLFQEAKHRDRVRNSALPEAHALIGGEALLKWITVIVVEPGKAPDVRELPNNLKAFELTIQAYIESVETIRPRCVILYDGSYTLTQKPFSRADIQGTFIILRVDGSEPISLSKEDIDILTEVYK